MNNLRLQNEALKRDLAALPSKLHTLLKETSTLAANNKSQISAIEAKWKAHAEARGKLAS